ncbi:MAG: DUF4180 domain-containing protein [Eubacteriales bacterium]|nr:DUF4180 domain-containing protein [Eubacteriales bacterium]
MSIQYIVLGYLSTASQSGYDLKKAIAAHPFLPWSGNNNQIYKSLMDLENQGFIESETVIQSMAPNKKIYKITNPGRALLKYWLYEPVLPASFNHPLLVKLQFADPLKPADWFEIFMKYRQELHDRLLLFQHMPLPRLSTAKPQKPGIGTGTGDLAASCNKLALKYEITRLENEIQMVNQFLDLVKVQAGWKDPASLPQDPLGQDMNPSIVYPPAGSVFERLKVHRLDVDELPVLELTGESAVMASEQDALDLLALCSEHRAQGILASTSLFHDDFFRLKTGIAGAILQKLANYQVRLALVRQPEQKIKGKFLEFMNESNHGSHFAILDSRDEAIRWLIH